MKERNMEKKAAKALLIIAKELKTNKNLSPKFKDSLGKVSMAVKSLLKELGPGGLNDLLKRPKGPDS